MGDGLSVNYIFMLAMKSSDGEVISQFYDCILSNPSKLEKLNFYSSVNEIKSRLINIYQ